MDESTRCSRERVCSLQDDDEDIEYVTEEIDLHSFGLPMSFGSNKPTKDGEDGGSERRRSGAPPPPRHGARAARDGFDARSAGGGGGVPHLMDQRMVRPPPHFGGGARLPPPTPPHGMPLLPHHSRAGGARPPAPPPGMAAHHPHAPLPGPPPPPPHMFSQAPGLLHRPPLGPPLPPGPPPPRPELLEAPSADGVRPSNLVIPHVVQLPPGQPALPPGAIPQSLPGGQIILNQVLPPNHPLHGLRPGVTLQIPQPPMPNIIQLGQAGVPVSVSGGPPHEKIVLEPGMSLPPGLRPINSVGGPEVTQITQVRARICDVNYRCT